MPNLVIKGRTFHRVDPTLAKILESLFPEDVQRAAVVPIEKRPPRWVVNINQFTGLPQIVLTLGNGQNHVYPGPTAANTYGELAEAQAAFASTGFPLPDEIAKQFAEARAAAIERNGAKRWAYETGYKGDESRRGKP